MFRIGQKVVCVDDSAPISYQGVKEGNTYTVIGVGTLFGGLPSVAIEGIANTSGASSWLASRFRPVVEKSTDTGMAILREILDRESVEERKPVKARA